MSHYMKPFLPSPSHSSLNTMGMALSGSGQETPCRVLPQHLCLHQSSGGIVGKADGVFKRLMQAISRSDLAEDSRFVDNPGRTVHQEFLDDIISDWTSQHTLDEVMEAMIEAGVPAGPIYDAADIMNDPHFRARAMIEDHEVSIEPGERSIVRFPGIVPKLSETPGETQWLGPSLGAHNEEVYGQLLGFTSERLEQLKQSGFI